MTLGRHLWGFVRPLSLRLYILVYLMGVIGVFQFNRLRWSFFFAIIIIINKRKPVASTPIFTPLKTCLQFAFFLNECHFLDSKDKIDASRQVFSIAIVD
jgi:hypothetical protein